MKKCILLLAFILPLKSFAVEMPTITQDVPLILRNQLTNDFYTLSQMQSNNGTHIQRMIFGNANGDNYLNFINQRINTIGLSSCNGNPSELACATGFFAFFKRMWITPSFMNSQLSLVERIGIYIHEARHTETLHLNWNHTDCLYKNRKDFSGRLYGAEEFYGSAACDDTFEGAYGVQVIMQKNLSLYCENCSSKIKMDASLNADEYMGRIIHIPSRQTLISDLY